MMAKLFPPFPIDPDVIALDTVLFGIFESMLSWFSVRRHYSDASQCFLSGLKVRFEARPINLPVFILSSFRLRVETRAGAAID